MPSRILKDSFVGAEEAIYDDLSFIRRLRPQAPPFCANAPPNKKVCAKYTLLRACELLLALLLVSAASLETAICACDALRARATRPPPPSHPLILFTRRVLAHPPQILWTCQHKFTREDFGFDLNYFVMERTHTGERGCNSTTGLVGALRTRWSAANLRCLRAWHPHPSRYIRDAAVNNF